MDTPPVPQQQVVGMADPSSAPIRTTSYMGSLLFYANFNYQQPVDIVVGLITCDFQKVYWLDPVTCNLGERISWLMRGETLFCPIVSSPEGNGYIFWLVSPVSLIDLDFKNGAYELLFLPVGTCQ